MTNIENKSKLTAIVKTIMSNGLIIEIDGEKGFVRQREISWENRRISTYDNFKEGDQIQVLPYREAEDQDQYYSIKRAQKDPWHDNLARYQDAQKKNTGKVVQGVIHNVFPNRIHVILEDNNEAVFYPENLSYSLSNNNSTEDLTKYFVVGDHIKAAIKEINLKYKNFVLDLDKYQEILMKERREKKSVQSPFAQLRDFAPQLVSISHSVSGDAEKNFELFHDQKVLLVEDKTDHREKTISYLKKAGTEFIAPTSLNEFEAIIDNSKNFDLLLLDKNLNEWQQGLQITKYLPKLLDTFSNSFFVITTGEGTENLSLESFKSQIHYILEKPLFYDEILTVFNASKMAINKGSFGEMHRMSENVKFQREFASNVKSLREGLEPILKMICHSSKGKLQAAILKMDPITFETECVCAFPATGIDWVMAKNNLRFSPVENVISGEEVFYEQKLSSNRKKNFPPELPFCSFLGLPVRTFGETTHGLFLFGERRDTIGRDVIHKAGEATFFISGLLERSLMEEIFLEEGIFSSMGRLYLAMGHEIRNAVDGFKNIPPILKKKIEDLIYNPTTIPDLKSFQSIINDNLNQLEKSCENIYKTFDFYAKLKKDEIPVKIHLSPLLEEVVEDLRKGHCPDSIHIELSVESNLTVKGSRIKLKQVLRNLLLNSCQLMKEFGPIYPYIEINANQEIKGEEPVVRLMVTDSGPGIHTRDWEKIFEPFVSTREKGMGLGLYICRLLMHAMGGKIQIFSSYRFIGTTFLIELPAE